MRREILVSSDALEDRVALLEDGRLEEIIIARGERMVGSVYKGRVMNVLPGMQAAFVDIGLERNTFLCLDDALPSYLHDERDDNEIEDDSKRSRHRITSIEEIVKPGQETLVQVIKEPIGSKGGRITTNISLPGRYLVLLPHGNYVGVSRRVGTPDERDRLRTIAEKIKPKNMGVIIRTVAESKEESVLRKDLDALVKTWKEVAKKAEKARAPVMLHQELGLVDRVMRDMLNENVSKLMVDSRPIFEKVLEFAKMVSPAMSKRIYYYEGAKPLFDLHNIEGEIEKLLRKKVWLRSGGYLIIEPTEALTVIDVNTGKYVGSRSLDETILKINLEAAEEIARQIRLRDLSGIIIVDFIDMERREDRKKLTASLEGHLKEDRSKPSVFGITNLGLIEITRKRSGRNLDRILREECFYCAGHGRTWTPESIAIRLEREIRRGVALHRELGVLIVCHPQVALNLAGWEGERLALLGTSLGKEVFLRVDSDFHLEHFQVQWEDPIRITEKFIPLKEGATIMVEPESIHPLNLQNGVVFLHGQILEVANAGNQLGETLHVRVKFATHSYALAEPVRAEEPNPV